MIKTLSKTFGLDDYDEVLLTVLEYNGAAWLRLRKVASFSEGGGLVCPGYDCTLNAAQSKRLKELLNENPTL